MTPDSVTRALAAMPEATRAAISRHADSDPDFVAKKAEQYVLADEESRRDIDEFFAGSWDPAHVEEVWKEVDGTPTSEDLRGWMG